MAEPLTSRHVVLDDNRLCAHVFGEHHRHLARIEQKLGVTMIARGNQVVIQGEEADAAGKVLHDLYDRAERGLDIDGQEVDAAIRFAQGRDALPSGGMVGAAQTLRTDRRIIGPRTPNQALYLQALMEHELVFGLGPAGTGKTYLAVAAGVALLKQRRVDRLILSRPAVEAGERLGFLPGDMKEKVDPYLRPLYDALHDMLPEGKLAQRIEAGVIEIAPLAFMRGRTLSNAFVILDEAQNTTPGQMKMFLTRLGEHSRMVVTGDPSQCDLPPGTISGLADAARRLEGVQGVGCVRFTVADVVRHPLVMAILDAYDRPMPAS
ncbi:PhoH family protein [Marinivivus vitaminiproducens]|nr:PhoH family protein [Geminicoccaceae bacterium SCSIO 64248]